MKVPGTEISRHICLFSFFYVLNIFSLKSSENKDIKPGRKKHLYEKEPVVVKFNLLYITLTNWTQRDETLQETIIFRDIGKSISYSDL